ncbi:MAG: hypothetical protein IT364_04340 [Candidatus Hydrogenedentes bacterium]|nr:hypothetical protein [Candidatus Hydrogenedentota bacterium]
MATCVDDDTVEYQGTWAIFSAIDVPAMGINNQDKDRDGFPDPGERPIVVVPSQLLSKRVQLREPYPLIPLDQPSSGSGTRIKSWKSSRTTGGKPNLALPTSPFGPVSEKPTFRK